jgi:RNA polymerase sigma factor (sigma-70 family)
VTGVDDSERALVDGLRRGDAAAFDAVYALYKDRIYGFLFRLSGRRHLADDLFQEVFLKLARHATALREDTQLAAWLFTVARNQWRGHQRWLLGGGGRQLPDEIAPEPGPDPDQEAQRRAELRALEVALAELPDAAREVLLLVGVEGLDQEQAAQVLGLSYEALRQRLSRARAQLADKLREEHERPKRSAAR